MPFDWQPVFLSLKLATTTTAILLIGATPLAWWLARNKNRYKQILSALVALPLVLPPTVLGFYLLVLMAPNGAIGQLTLYLGLGTLPFTFAGLVIASVIYSLPFAVQPLQNSFESLPQGPLDAAATLRASPWDRFFSIVLPLSRSGFITATVLTFAHTLGEFGVVLMIGGSIPGSTKVLSIAIFEHVEALEYGQAHLISAAMVGFSFIVLLCLYTFNGRSKQANAGQQP